MAVVCVTLRVLLLRSDRHVPPCPVAPYRRSVHHVAYHDTVAQYNASHSTIRVRSCTTIL
eukprot:3936412-Rhodomonas_salina.2